MKSRSFLSESAFMRKPQAKKDMHVKKSDAIACVSPKYSPIRIGRTVSKPEI